MKKTLLLFAVLLSFVQIFAQEEASQSEVTKKKGLVYYEGRPFSGWLLSDETISGNECECTLKARYKNGKKNGLMQQWYRNGTLKYSGYYRNNVKVGEHKYYYPNGKLKRIERYKSGGIVEKTYYLKNGRKQKFEKFKNGMLVDAINYIKTDETKTNPSQITRDKTQKKKNKSSKEKNNENNVIQLTEPDQEVEIPPLENGLQKILYPGGQTKRVIFYKNGVIAKDSLFYENGQLQTAMKFEDGELIHSEKYDEAGQILEENNFSNNKKNGYQKKYYPGGQVKEIAFYNMGQLEHLEQYNETGKPVKEENYRFGKPHGDQKYYDENGKLVEYKLYDTGMLKRHERYTSEGKEVITATGDLYKIEVYDLNDRLKNIHFENIQTRKKDSTWTEFDENGNKVKEILYKNDRIYRKGKFKNGKKDGLWVYYWKNKVGETREWYQDGNLVKTQKIDYRRQIKNLFKEGDALFKYNTPESSGLYILVRKDYPVESNTDQLVYDKFLEVAADIGLERIINVQPVEDEQVYHLITLKNLKTQMRHHRTMTRKVIFLMSVEVSIRDLIEREEYENKWVITPVTTRYPNLESHYTSDVQKAISETLSNFKIRSQNLLSKYYPLKIIARRKSISGNSVYDLYLNLGEEGGIKRGDKFKLMDNDHSIGEAYVISTTPRFAVAKVSKGGKDLFEYFKTHRIIIAVKQ